MAYVTDLPKALAARGLTVELVPGWQTRGSSAFAPFGALAHWTAGPRTGDRPSLSVVVNGRTDLPGPLAQVFLARNGNAVVVAAGRANHAGPGYHQGADGNTDLFGCECEWDGTAAGLTPEQEWAYPRVMAAFMDLGARFVASHAEYALPKGRKVDVGSYIHTLRAQTAALRTSPTPTTSEEDDMEIHELIDFRVDGRNIWDSLKDIYRFTQTSRDLDTAQTAQITALTAAVTALATSKGVDPAQAQAAVTRAVDAALADLTITLTAKES